MIRVRMYLSRRVSGPRSTFKIIHKYTKSVIPFLLSIMYLPEICDSKLTPTLTANFPLQAAFVPEELVVPR
jgi:hypothetical protein